MFSMVSSLTGGLPVDLETLPDPDLQFQIPELSQLMDNWIQLNQQRRSQVIRQQFIRQSSNNRAVQQQQDLEEAAILMISLATMGGPLRKIKTYLTRADLPGDPLAESAWAYLWSSQSNRAFITTMGIDVETFGTLLKGFAPLWNSRTLIRNDVSRHGEPQVLRRSLNAAGCLGLILHWLSSTMSAYSLQQLFAITPAVCSRYLETGLQHLLVVLKSMNEARIRWPSTKRAIKPYSDAIEKKFPLLRRCFGFVDGLNLPVLVSEDDDIQNAYYNGWTCSHYCSCILAFAPDGSLIYAILNAPGSWHDSAIAEPLYTELLHNTPPGYRILSDTAFPRKSERLQQRILAPVKRGDRLPETPRRFSRLKVLNDQVVSARQAAEWGMHSIQGSFSRLKLPLPASDHTFRFNILQVVCRLHQIRTRMVGINQTKSVYEAVWDQDKSLCNDFHHMLFSTIQKQCHISRYYNGWL